jgi:hypothetical protein
MQLDKREYGKILKIALKPLFEVGVVFNNFHISFFRLFWTISPDRMGLMIWLGVYFQAETLGHTSRLLVGLCVLFWVHLEMSK